MMVDKGIRLLATVHDAVLFEESVEGVASSAAVVKECWEIASEEVIGIRLKSDCKIFRYSDRFHDEDGESMWAKIVSMMPAEAVNQ
jgi:hypothetical protein